MPDALLKVFSLPFRRNIPGFGSCSLTTNCLTARMPQLGLSRLRLRGNTRPKRLSNPPEWKFGCINARQGSRGRSVWTCVEIQPVALEVLQIFIQLFGLDGDVDFGFRALSASGYILSLYVTVLPLAPRRGYALQLFVISLYGSGKHRRQ